MSRTRQTILGRFDFKKAILTESRDGNEVPDLAIASDGFLVCWLNFSFRERNNFIQLYKLKLYRPLLCPAEIKGKSVTDHQQDT